MTEADWLACNDPTPMLAYLRGTASYRKRLLFGVACCRRVWHQLQDARSHRVIEVAERFVDGSSTEEEMEAARSDAALVFQKRDYERMSWAASLAAMAAWLASYGSPRATARAAAASQTWTQGHESEEGPQCDLIREVFGNPFRPVTFDPAWLSWHDGAIPKLAQAIYCERGFERLPDLGRALEDAGCTDSDILNHCRQPGVHVRGCWVVDLLLGKE
jgi:hypothetical protein